MKTPQLEHTSSCCSNSIFAMLQQCTKAALAAFTFMYPVPSGLYIHNAHPPPKSILLH